MNTAQLEKTVKAIIAPGKGVLAADESDTSCKKRFDAVNIPCTADTRRDYRSLLVTAPDFAKTISGVILYEETFSQTVSDTKSTFAEFLTNIDVMPGIKLDQGLVDLPNHPGEQLSKGLDTLPERIEPFMKAGATFAKWRSVIRIDSSIPSYTALSANAHVLAHYAAICQQFDIVPFVEPEVLFEGTHTIDRCEAVMIDTYHALFEALERFKVHLPGVILKTSFVMPGKDSGDELHPEKIADHTLRALYDHTPRELGGIVFLSGGTTSTQAFNNLAALHRRHYHPQGLTFSYSRAIQDPVLKTWAQDPDQTTQAHTIMARQLRLASQSLQGIDVDQEQDDFTTQSQD